MALNLVLGQGQQPLIVGAPLQIDQSIVHRQALRPRHHRFHVVPGIVTVILHRENVGDGVNVSGGKLPVIAAPFNGRNLGAKIALLRLHSLRPLLGQIRFKRQLHDGLHRGQTASRRVPAKEHNLGRRQTDGQQRTVVTLEHSEKPRSTRQLTKCSVRPFVGNGPRSYSGAQTAREAVRAHCIRCHRGRLEWVECGGIVLGQYGATCREPGRTRSCHAQSKILEDIV